MAVEKQQEEMDKKFNMSGGAEMAQPNKTPKERPPIPDFAFNTRAPKK